MDAFAKAFPYREDDVVIVSYPRSGSTWLRFIFANLIRNTVGDGSTSVDFLFVQRFMPAISAEIQRKGVDYEALPSPRIMRTHSLYIKEIPKVIYLMRDGRDVLVSYYMYFKKSNVFEGSFADFLVSNMRGVEWDQHVTSWLYNNSSLRNVCVVKYEDLLKTPVLEVERLAAFIGLECGRDQIHKAVHESSFEKMRQVEENTGLGFFSGRNDQIPFVRKGESGTWKKVFGEKDKARVKEMYGNVLLRTGYASDYRW